MSTLRTQELTKSYGGRTVVRGVSLDIASGEVVGLLGPNGAGKSTTLRMLLGLVRPTHGDATVLGMPYESLDRPSRAVGAVLESSVWPAVQNLLLTAHALGLGSALTTITTVFGDELRSLLALPGHVRPLGVVPLGWPARGLGPPRTP